MVDARLPFPVEPLPRIHGQKPDNASGKDLAPGADFAAAVSLDTAASNAEEARSREDQPSETVALDPELEADEAVAALSQTVAAFIVSGAAPGKPAGSPESTGADGTVINASPAAQLRAALPGLAHMGSASAGADGPAGPTGAAGPGRRTPSADTAALPDASAGDAHADSVGKKNQVDPAPSEAGPVPQTGIVVQAEIFRLPGAAAPVAALAVARAMAAVAADDPHRPIDPLQPPAAHGAARPSGNWTTGENAGLPPGTGDARILAAGTDPGLRKPSASVPEAGVESAGTDRSPPVSGTVDNGQAQPSVTILPADAGAAQRGMPHQPQSIALEAGPAATPDGGEPTSDPEASPPSRPASDAGSAARIALPQGPAVDGAKAPSGGQALPDPAAAIFFAQLPGIAGAPAASPAEQLRPILPARGDFTPGAPLRYLEIVLAPPELGTVRVVITREEGEMRVEMIAATSKAVDMLESARESMVDAIRDAGLRAASIEIRQDLQAARPTGTGDFANGSAWNGRQEQGRQQGPENWQATRGHSYGQPVRTAEAGVQNQGLIL